MWHSIFSSLKLSLSFSLNGRIFCSFPLSAIRATCTAQSHPPPFHIANNITWRVTPMKLSLLTVLLSPTSASLSHSNIYSQSYSERIYTFFLGWQTRFCTHTKKNWQLPLSHVLLAAALISTIYDSSTGWNWAPSYPPPLHSRGSEWPLPYVTRSQ
jgi:hypothetical protein